MKNKSRYFYLSNLIIFSLLGCKTQKSSTPNVIYIFPDQMRNHAMGFWREARFRDAVNFEGDPVHTPNLDRFAKESVVLTSAMSNCRSVHCAKMRPALATCSAKPDITVLISGNCMSTARLPMTRNVPENMWKTVFRLGMPTLRQNAGTVSTIGIRTGPMTCTSIRTIGIPKASNTR